MNCNQERPLSAQDMQDALSLARDFHSKVNKGQKVQQKGASAEEKKTTIAIGSSNSNRDLPFNGIRKQKRENDIRRLPTIPLPKLPGVRTNSSVSPVLTTSKSHEHRPSTPASHVSSISSTSTNTPSSAISRSKSKNRSDRSDSVNNMSDNSDDIAMGSGVESDRIVTSNDDDENDGVETKCSWCDNPRARNDLCNRCRQKVESRARRLMEQKIMGDMKIIKDLSQYFRQNIANLHTINGDQYNNLFEKLFPLLVCFVCLPHKKYFDTIHKYNCPFTLSGIFYKKLCLICF